MNLLACIHDKAPLIEARDPDLGDLFPPGFLDLYEVHSYRNAARILAHACTAEFREITERLTPGRLILMPNRLHRPMPRSVGDGTLRALGRAAVVPGLDRVISHGARTVVRPGKGVKLSVRRNPAARDLIRHAMADVGGNANLARSWSKLARELPRSARREVLDLLPRLDFPVLLLWADEDRHHPLRGAEEALDLLPDAILRVLPGTGYLIAYDDPVGVARELLSFLS